MRQWLRDIWDFSRGSFARNVASVGGGAAAGQAIVLVASPVLTRLYTPEEFGVLAVFASVIGILMSISAARYEIAIPIPNSDSASAALTVLGLCFVMCITLASAAGVLFFGDTFVSWTNTDALKPYLWFIPIGLLGIGVYRVLNYWVVRRRAYTVVARTKISQNISRVVSQVGLGLFGAGPVGLIIGDVLGRVGGTTSLAVYAWRNDRSLFGETSWWRMRAMARRYIKFPLLAGPSALFNKAALEAPALFFASLFAPSVAGWFALAQRMVGVPVWLVAESVQQVFLGDAAEQVQTSPRDVKRLYLRLSGLLLIGSVIPAAVLGLAGEWVFSFVFGTEWAVSGQYAQWMVIAFIPQIVVSPLSMTLNLLEKQGAQLWWDSGRFLVLLGVFGSAYMIDASPSTTVLLVASALGASYIVLWGLGLWFLQRRVKQHARARPTA
jgi:O-antigen/teichoic acid export membrane protein